MAKTNKNLEQYFKLPTKRVAIDNTYSKNSPKVDVSDDKAMVDRLLREKSIEAQRSKEKRIADVRRLEELNKKPMLETANPKDLYDIGEGMKSKYRFSNEDNFFDDYINPFNMVGGIAGGLAQTPELINQGEYGNAALNVGLPLGVGALSGIGAQNIGQFTNNLVNPLAGSGDLVNNLGNKYLPNTYKLNPLAKKAENFNNPNSFYRQVDDETFKEGLESGLIKGKQNVDKTNGENLINLNKSFGDDAYYKKGSLYSPQRADYIYEVNKGEDFFTPKVNGRTRKYTTENTPIRVSREPIPLTESNIYQKDWLQGYKLLKFESGGEMQPLNFRDFFGNGGKKTLPPIYVDNRNDPRLLALPQRFYKNSEIIMGEYEGDDITEEHIGWLKKNGYNVEIL